MMNYNSYPPNKLQSIVQRTVKDLTPHAGEFDVIAVRGVSGMVVGAPVSITMGKPLVVVRKENELAHSGPIANNTYAVHGTRYLILDDFVAMGTTVREIMFMLDDYRMILAGTYMYGFDSKDDMIYPFRQGEPNYGWRSPTWLRP